MLLRVIMKCLETFSIDTTERVPLDGTGHRMTPIAGNYLVPNVHNVKVEKYALDIS